MNNQFFQPGRMESQYVNTKVVSVMYQASGVNAPVVDGTLAVLGGFYTDPIYTAAYGSNITDINTRIATLPASATVSGVGVIDVSTVPTASGVDGTTYKIGSETIGLSVEGGKPVRFRKFVIDDTFFTSLDNFTAAPTVGQYAIVDASGNWKPSATIPTSGTTAQIISTNVVSRGVAADVTQYFMLIVQVA
ncbi:hypothetical protein [Clostridium sp.]|uniref:hypothetical protein n=1 Tax=Clostridium sp. TaxID=1506 RepID=UPI0026117FD2|nr:hypothetical protein [Clostridium sp.]